MEFNLENNEEGKEDEHEEQQAAGVHGEQVVFVWKIRLRRKKIFFKKSSLSPTQHQNGSTHLIKI